MSGESRERRMHRRRSSASDEGDALFVITPPAESNTPSLAAPSPRTRVQSSPQQPRHQRNASISGLPLNIAPPPTAGPYRTAYPVSPFRTSFSHSRTLSFSSPFSPTLPSPLSASTSFADQIPVTIPETLTASQSAPSANEADPSAKSRRHNRIHSRNLSVFFPRPGALPQHTIDEDGNQELEVPPTLGAGFTFGKTPPGELPTPPPLTPSSSASRRGHHHKHSMSHTLFSFLEPHGNAMHNLHTQPTPIPVSPWMPISPFVADAPKPVEKLNQQQPARAKQTPFLAAATAQFLLGATLWVKGQQSGSLAVTALGYWAVFDAIGVAIPHVTLVVSRPYATARALPVLLFAQSVYLMFSAVYVCKEALEHLLLSASTGDGHHHHAGDEAAGIDFPTLSTACAFIALTLTAILLDNHSRLVALAGNRIPPLTAILNRTPAYAVPPAPPTAQPARALSNPYAATPLILAFGILCTALLAPAIQHRMLDLALAGAASAATFTAAYRACTVLGAVLLQTAPPRKAPGARMEAFLRAMRDVERHPQVLHLPAPHIWQLAPADGQRDADKDERHALVVTLELHVSGALPDDDVLALTRWTRERCVASLGGGGEAEVAVGVVRG
ncbi:hypothetical protein B0H15DRAFT_846174 [Mycena belliarum]|uniref:Zinc transporter 6 n=1 Tax=Mycena belliarum TaxID=1033014 RepID=A0AAD6U0E4_9AGAR|nr:hypothetical protein B0H15DRAFT_846174 [Mycena belliae]